MSHVPAMSALVAAIFCAVALPASAQDVDRITVPLSDPSRPANVKVEVVRGNITVKAYDGKEVVVEARRRPDEGPKSEGRMTRIPVGGTRLSARERDNTVKIEIGAWTRFVDVSIMVPSRMATLNVTSGEAGDVSVTGVEAEMEVAAGGGSVTLTNVSGSAVAHAYKGKLLAQFDRVTPQKPMAFSSFSADLDLTFPSDLKATLAINSNSGDVFSDFVVQRQFAAPGKAVTTRKDVDGTVRVEADDTMHGTINGGGQEIQVRTYSGRIYLRKHN